jgi:flagellar assembly protein FliH
MKVFRPYRFPPLAQFAGEGSADGARLADTEGQWQASVSEGFEQGQRDGYDAGLERGREDGFAAGHAEGLQRGRDMARLEAQAHFEQLAKPVDALFKGLKKLRSDFRAAQRKEVVELVAKVARQVIRAELALQPAQMLTLVDETLASMPPTREEIDVYLNPEELKRIVELDPKRAKRWNLMADARLDAGECRIRAGDEEVDAGCHQRLAAVMEQVDAQLATADAAHDKVAA